MRERSTPWLARLALPAPLSGDADAFDYSPVANADGDSASSLDDSSVEAKYSNPLDPGAWAYEVYFAGAGALAALAQCAARRAGRAAS